MPPALGSSGFLVRATVAEVDGRIAPRDGYGVQQLIEGGIHGGEDRTRQVLAGEPIKEHLLALEVPVAVAQEFEMPRVEHVCGVPGR
ncbi:hypothetical protein BG844_13655 [Couchioplanes caeruleus subsp. caeruleus]|uniref:Uncharacterized protein n=1 Tax=Couchioplanes caeruleus subsp. caeruleus TaxID=56427 RepID=A0A1K0FLI7_9ACTN|nr:hypothetical protein BG844_13655 [Couchioplanes caeruleus subsp. caeruleus]